ncbi:heterokaryon incompatibility protein-domain-containing protein [Rhexocercosporidium sp. MPI-PUGE-AT-0058]|nr:heterokaryon incompatibility protein-domain-containing protein [Rhexocercosporidium sp. MPI-PUGE-AT-0058]
MPKVSFVWAGAGREVSVVGSVNREKPIKLELLSKRGSPAVFRGEFRVDTSVQKVFYKFIVDGKSTLDDSVAQENWPGHGMRNVTTPRSSKTASQPYPYRKLDFDNYDFRVLVLKFSDSDDGKLDCYLEHESLINPGSYLALSYCWGNQETTRSIQIGGHFVEITTNLAAALYAVRRLRCPTATKGLIRLWVDAICINQTDNEERSNQVRNMRQIYAKSSEVLSWVGSGALSGFPSEAVEYLIKKQSLIQRLNDATSSHRDAQMLLDDFSSFSFATKEAWVENKLNIMDAFFNQPYWKRVWIIQEVTVASRVTIVWGNAEIPWEVVAKALSVWKMMEISNGPRQTRGFTNALHLLEFHDHGNVKPQPISLLDAISWSHQTLSTDPRDRIFALLGLCHDGPRFVPVPNYKQSLEAIMTDMVLSMMRYTKSLDLICLKGVGVKRPASMKLPSWVPNIVDLWSRSLTIQEKSFFDWKSVNSFMPVLDGSDATTLKVKGKFLGKITSLSTGMSTNGIIRLPTHPREPWIHATSNLIRKDPRLWNSSDEHRDLRDALYRTLTMCLLPESISYDCARDCFASLWIPTGRGAIHNLALIDWIDSNAEFRVQDFTLREWSMLKSGYDTQTYKNDLYPDKTLLEVFIATLEKVLGSGMKLAALDGSQMLAMVHPDARVGDKLYALKGCTIPVTLRVAIRPTEVGLVMESTVVGGAYLLGRDKLYHQRHRNGAEMPDIEWGSVPGVLELF